MHMCDGTAQLVRLPTSRLRSGAKGCRRRRVVRSVPKKPLPNDALSQPLQRHVQNMPPSRRPCYRHFTHCNRAHASAAQRRRGAHSVLSRTWPLSTASWRLPMRHSFVGSASSALVHGRRVILPGLAMGECRTRTCLTPALPHDQTQGCVCLLFHASTARMRDSHPSRSKDDARHGMCTCVWGHMRDERTAANDSAVCDQLRRTCVCAGEWNNVQEHDSLDAEVCRARCIMAGAHAAASSPRVRHDGDEQRRWACAHPPPPPHMRHAWTALCLCPLLPLCGCAPFTQRRGIRSTPPRVVRRPNDSSTGKTKDELFVTETQVYDYKDNEKRDSCTGRDDAHATGSREGRSSCGVRNDCCTLVISNDADHHEKEKDTEWEESVVRRQHVRSRWLDCVRVRLEHGFQLLSHEAGLGGCEGRRQSPVRCCGSAPDAGSDKENYNGEDELSVTLWSGSECHTLRVDDTRLIVTRRHRRERATTSGRRCQIAHSTSNMCCYRYRVWNYLHRCARLDGGSRSANGAPSEVRVCCGGEFDSRVMQVCDGALRRTPDWHRIDAAIWQGPSPGPVEHTMPSAASASSTLADANDTQAGCVSNTTRPSATANTNSNSIANSSENIANTTTGGKDTHAAHACGLHCPDMLVDPCVAEDVKHVSVVLLPDDAHHARPDADDWVQLLTRHVLSGVLTLACPCPCTTPPSTIAAVDTSAAATSATFNAAAVAAATLSRFAYKSDNNIPVMVIRQEADTMAEHNVSASPQRIRFHLRPTALLCPSDSSRTKAEAQVGGGDLVSSDGRCMTTPVLMSVVASLPMHFHPRGCHVLTLSWRACTAAMVTSWLGSLTAHASRYRFRVVPMSLSPTETVPTGCSAVCGVEEGDCAAHSATCSCVARDTIMRGGAGGLCHGTDSRCTRVHVVHSAPPSSLHGSKDHATETSPCCGCACACPEKEENNHKHNTNTNKRSDTVVHVGETYAADTHTSQRADSCAVKHADTMPLTAPMHTTRPCANTNLLLHLVTSSDALAVCYQVVARGVSESALQLWCERLLLWLVSAEFRYLPEVPVMCVSAPMRTRLVHASGLCVVWLMRDASAASTHSCHVHWCENAAHRQGTAQQRALLRPFRRALMRACGGTRPSVVAVPCVGASASPPRECAVVWGEG